MDISDIFHIYYSVGEQAISDFCKKSKLITYSIGDTIVEQNTRSSHLFLVKTGIFRISCVFDGVEDTISFGHDGDAFMSLHSYYSREVSQFSCIALTDMEVYRIDFSELDNLMSIHIDLLWWFKNVLVEELYLLERRYIYFGAKDAYSRYVTFVAARPEIMKFVPVKYIAQYLKIRPETLYRIRARYIRSNGLTE